MIYMWFTGINYYKLRKIVTLFLRPLRTYGKQGRVTYMLDRHCVVRCRKACNMSFGKLSTNCNYICRVPPGQMARRGQKACVENGYVYFLCVFVLCTQVNMMFVMLL
jgi:hypothetical protein